MEQTFGGAFSLEIAMPTPELTKHQAEAPQEAASGLRLSLKSANIAKLIRQWRLMYQTRVSRARRQ